MSDGPRAVWSGPLTISKALRLAGGALFLAALTASLLAGASVQQGPASAAECGSDFVIDFQGLPAGTIIAEQYASRGVHISGLAYGDGFPDTLIVFDSNASGTNDPDLEVDIGNIAIFANNLTDNNGDGLVDFPDENNFGGTQIYSFDQPVHIGSFLFIDKDHGTPDIARAFDASGNLVATASIPVSTNGSVQTINVNADGVSRLEIDYHDSAALTGIQVDCPETLPATQTPTPTATAAAPAATPTLTPVVAGASATPTAEGQEGAPVVVAVVEAPQLPRYPVSLPATGGRRGERNYPALLVLAGALLLSGCAAIAIASRSDKNA